MITVLSSIFFFILALGILITVHEFGHYWVARKVGVKVLRFSVGFGKPLWSKTAGADNTEYVLAAIPLGGYVRMLDEREADVDEAELHRAFNRQSLAKRTAVVVAGPLFNFILAIAAYWLIFVIGVTGMKPIVGQVSPNSIAELAGLQQGEHIVAIGDRATPTWAVAVVAMLDNAMDSGEVVIKVERPNEPGQIERLIHFDGIPDDLNRGGLLDFVGLRPYRPAIPAIIGKLAPNGSADRAGLEVGDKIISVDGEAIDDWEQLVDYVRARPERQIEVGVDRGVEQLKLSITPVRVEGDVGKIGAGVQMQDMPEELKSEVKYGPAIALARAASKTWDMSFLTLRMLGKMVTGDISLSNLSGPISIARYAGYSASIGFVSFLTFLAIVSISLGVLNLLPVPMLDGGHLLYYLVEFFKGSPVSENTQIIGQKLGIAMLLGMMLLAFYNDILRFFVN